MIRVLLIILASAFVLGGFSQMADPTWWNGFVNSIVASPLFRLWGLLSILFGVVFIAASLKRSMGLRLFFWILGWIVAVAGLAMLINPSSTIEYTRAVYLNRSPETKVAVMWLGGIIRVGLGAAIYYAVVKPDTRVHSR